MEEVSTTMDITLLIHVEMADQEIVWWAESDDLPGVTVAAPSLMEMREELDNLLRDLAVERGEAIVITEEMLAESEDAGISPLAPATLGQEIEGERESSGPTAQSRGLLVPLGAVSADGDNHSPPV